MSLVKTVEKVEISILGTATSGTGSITKGQTVAKCVPFTTSSCPRTTSERFDTRLVRVTISGTTVTATRATGMNGADLKIIVYVVEFTSECTVQTGEVLLTGVASNTGSPGANFTSLTRTFMYFGYTRTGSDDDFSDSMVRGQITDTSTLTFTRADGVGNVVVRWYSVECDSTQFDVQRGSFQIAGSNNSANSAAITAVTLARTMLITSHDTDEKQDDPESGSITTDMVDTTHIRARRANGGSLGPNTNNVEYQVIQFEAAEGVNVYRGDFTIDVYEDTDTITSVNLLKAMAHSPENECASSTDSINGDDIGQCWARFDLENETTVRGRTTSNSIQGVWAWEVVEWELDTYKLEGVTRDEGGSTLGNCRCILLKHDGAAEGSRIYSIIAHVNSNASGNYSFTGLGDNDARYMVVAWNDATPDVRGVTDDFLQPVIE